MATATIRAWGNSKGLIIPKNICDLLGLSAGDQVSITPNAERSSIEISSLKRRYSRSEKLTSEQLFSAWDKPYSIPDDFSDSSSVGSEVSWGEPVGKEMW